MPLSDITPFMDILRMASRPDAFVIKLQPDFDMVEVQTWIVNHTPVGMCLPLLFSDGHGLSVRTPDLNMATMLKFRFG